MMSDRTRKILMSSTRTDEEAVTDALRSLVSDLIVPAVNEGMRSEVSPRIARYADAMAALGRLLCRRAEELAAQSVSVPVAPLSSTLITTVE